MGRRFYSRNISFPLLGATQTACQATKAPGGWLQFLDKRLKPLVSRSRRSSTLYRLLPLRLLLLRGRQRGRRLRLGSPRALGRRERRRSPPLRPRWSKTAASSSSSPAACAGFLWHRSDLSILIGSRPTRELFEPESQVDQGNDIATHTGRQSGRQAGRQAGGQAGVGWFVHGGR